jgi:ferredoxin-NADP reductase
MEKELAAGRQVWVKLPYGEFVVTTTQPAVLLAGGTGITTFTAFIAGLRPGYEQPVFLAYGARRPELLIYRDLVERQAASLPSLRYALFSESPTPDPHPPLLPGRISVASVWPLLAPPANTSIFVSGPPAMIHAVSSDLRLLGVTPDTIRIDAWE